MSSIAARSVPLLVRDWSSVFICGPLLGVVSFCGFRKVQSARFRRGGPGALLLSTIQCNCYADPTKRKPNTNMLGRCFSCLTGWHVDERYCNGGWYILGCCPSVCCFLSTHQVLVLAFCSDSVQRRHHRFFALWVIAGLTTFMSPLFTPNSTTAPSKQIYTELAQDGRPRRRRIRLPVQGRPHR